MQICSDVKAFESYRLTDRQTYIRTDRQTTDRHTDIQITDTTKIIDHAASRVVKKKQKIQKIVASWVKPGVICILHITLKTVTA